MSAYTVHLKDTDCGPFNEGRSFDEFALMFGETIIATLSCHYCENSTQYILKTDQSHRVPSIANDLHLTASIMNTVKANMTPKNEMYYEAFQDENGQKVARALVI